MTYQINLSKMPAFLENGEAQYYLPGEEEIFLNEKIGQRFSIENHQSIHCVRCGKKTNKSFAQGFCYPCFVSAPETEECVLRPELCQAHLGIARDMDYATKNCLSDQHVYLALSSELKVGVTRKSQVPTRWIDQGASKAITLAITPNRHLAGEIEVFLKQHLTDKTNWRNMLKNIIKEGVNLTEEKEKVSQLLPDELRQYVVTDNSITNIQYPVNEFPTKPKPVNLDKITYFEGILQGIKGQYLFFEDNAVLNIRKYSGYDVSIEV